MSKSGLQRSAGDELVLESSPARCYQLRVSRLDVFDLSLCRTLNPWLYSRSRARVLQSPSSLRYHLPILEFCFRSDQDSSFDLSPKVIILLRVLLSIWPAGPIAVCRVMSVPSAC